MKLTISLLISLLTATSAFAHGYVAEIDIAGKSYAGNVPGGRDNPSVIFQISDVSPVKGASNPSLNCGLNATPATLVASANPGDKIDFHWKGGGGSNWPHNTGPMLTYMASCGDQSCIKFNSTTAKWFKIQQIGQKSDGAWAQADIMAGAPASITLPSNIASGNYLIRHEIIALQLAVSMGGAEFYPSCSQLTIGGSGTGKPQDSELVSFPGAYHDDDPGIYVPNVYNGNLDYQFPGPHVSSFVGDSNSGSSGSSTGGNSSATTSPPPQPTSSGSSSSCKLKSRVIDGSATYRRRSLGHSASTGSMKVKYYPRYMSRVMRNIIFGDAY